MIFLGENMVMRQKKGIAIGGYISSALAILLANYMLNIWL